MFTQIIHYTRCTTPKCVTSWRDPSPRHCARATQLLSIKCRNGGEPLATLCPIWLIWGLNLRLPAPEMNASWLYQLAGSVITLSLGRCYRQIFLDWFFIWELRALLDQTTLIWMYKFAERTVKSYCGNKAKTELYSQLFIVSTVEAETMSNSERKFNELHNLWIFRENVFARYDNTINIFNNNMIFSAKNLSLDCGQWHQRFWNFLNKNEKYTSLWLHSTGIN